MRAGVLEGSYIVQEISESKVRIKDLSARATLMLVKQVQNYCSRRLR
jgi:hypothetical protein